MPRIYKKIGQSATSNNPFSSWTKTKITFYVFLVLVLVALGLVIWSLIYTYQKRTNFKLTNDVFSGENLDFNSYYNIPCTNETYGNETKTFSGNTHLVSACPQTSNTCSEFFCGTNRFCTEKTSDGNECSSNAECGLGSRCDLDTCECSPSIINCTTNSDCPKLDSNPCLESTCVDGACSYNFTAGADCASTVNCNEGFSCNSTCMCVPVVSVQEFTPEFSGPNITFVAWTLNPPSYLDSVFKDLGEWVEVIIYLNANQFDASITGGNLGFDFTLPILPDTSELGMGVFNVACHDMLTAAETCFSCSGEVFLITSTSKGEAVCTNQNNVYNGTSVSHLNDIEVIFLYKKA